MAHELSESRQKDTISALKKSSPDMTGTLESVRQFHESMIEFLEHFDDLEFLKSKCDATGTAKTLRGIYRRKRIEQFKAGLLQELGLECEWDDQGERGDRGR